MNPTPSTESNNTAVYTMVTTQIPVTKSTAMAATSIPVTMYNLVQGKFEGIPYPTEKPQEEEGPLPPAVTLPRKDSNLRPQPHKTGKIPHALILCQLPQTCLMQEHLGLFPQLKYPQLLKQNRQKRGPSQVSHPPMLWY